MARNFSPVIEHPVAYHKAVKSLHVIANAQKTWRANTERSNEIENAFGRRHPVHRPW
jgi:hypothetical protein